MQILLEFVRKISKRIKGGVSKMNNFKNMKLKNKIMIPIVILVFLILSVIIAGMSVILYNSKSQDKQKEIRESAKNYGLEISSEIENSFEKARAAASILKGIKESGSADRKIATNQLKKNNRRQLGVCIRYMECMGAGYV